MFKVIEGRLIGISRRLRQMFPERVVKVAVFGSRVRAEHGEGSDIDVLVVVKNREPEIERQIIEVFVEEQLRSGLPFAPVIKDLAVFEKEKKYNSPFYRAIVEEAVEV